MKKTITLLTTVLIFLAVEANASRLFLRTNTIQASANISGEQFFSHDGYFEITQLRAGNHRMTIFQRTARNNNHRGNSNRYGRDHRHQANRPVFRESIFMPQQSDVYARVTPRGRLIIDQVVPRIRTRQGRGADYGQRGNQYDNNSRNGGVRQPNRSGERAGSNFDVALRTINRASFDSEKKIIAKQYLRANSVTSIEVLDLIRSFDFESSRLEIAKFAYGSTLDPENYFMVNEGFQFSSSSRALNRFIQ